MATISHVPTSSDPIFAAIAAHRAAYDAYQVAPEGKTSLIANDDYDAASDDLVASACSTRFGALALLEHLRWWLADEAEFRSGHEPAYSIAEARAADLTLFLGTALPPTVARGGDVQTAHTLGEPGTDGLSPVARNIGRGRRFCRALLDRAGHEVGRGNVITATGLVILYLVGL